MGVNVGGGVWLGSVDGSVGPSCLSRNHKPSPATTRIRNATARLHHNRTSGLIDGVPVALLDSIENSFMQTQWDKQSSRAPSAIQELLSTLSEEDSDGDEPFEV